MAKARLERAVRGIAGWVLWLIGVMLNLTALCWLGFQGMRWLQTGAWTTQPTVFAWMREVCPVACSFATNPHSWFGAAKLVLLLQEIPSGLALAIVGFGFALLSVSVNDNRPAPPPARKPRALVQG